ncbi:MAG: TetR family transcriptional regulator [Desulfobacterium sp.]|nr:TetR family transcriptional regulator [Desulfobacterium sp.]
MKISKEQKETNRRAIISAMVDIVTDQGFKAATMKKIARQSGLGDATIYNYFPTKEAILFGYYTDHFTACTQGLKRVTDLNEYSLQEQIQTFFETSFDLFLKDREFVALTFKQTFFSYSQNYKLLKPIRASFTAIIRDMVEAAAEVGEIPEQVFQEVIVQLFMDFYIAMTAYWIADRSDNFNDTAILIDKSLGLAVAMLKAGIANKVLDITVFLFRTHILNNLGAVKDGMETMRSIKRNFMEASHAGEDPNR